MLRRCCVSSENFVEELFAVGEVEHTLKDNCAVDRIVVLGETIAEKMLCFFVSESSRGDATRTRPLDTELMSAVSRSVDKNKVAENKEDDVRGAIAPEIGNISAFFGCWSDILAHLIYMGLKLNYLDDLNRQRILNNICLDMTEFWRENSILVITCSGPLDTLFNQRPSREILYYCGIRL